MVLCTVLAVAALLSSCHGIYNDLEPCSQGVRLRFVYDGTLLARCPFAFCL